MKKGKYTLSVTPGNYIIVFSFLGYENIEVPVTVKSGEEIIINKALRFRELHIAGCCCKIEWRK
jgi:hypothetical protein